MYIVLFCTLHFTVYSTCYKMFCSIMVIVLMWNLCYSSYTFFLNSFGIYKIMHKAWFAASALNFLDILYYHEWQRAEGLHGDFTCDIVPSS